MLRGLVKDGALYLYRTDHVELGDPCREWD